MSVKDKKRKTIGSALQITMATEQPGLFSSKTQKMRMTSDTKITFTVQMNTTDIEASCYGIQERYIPLREEMSQVWIQMPNTQLYVMDFSPLSIQEAWQKFVLLHSKLLYAPPLPILFNVTIHGILGFHDDPYHCMNAKIVPWCFCSLEQSSLCNHHPSRFEEIDEEDAKTLLCQSNEIDKACQVEIYQSAASEPKTTKADKTTTQRIKKEIEKALRTCFEKQKKFCPVLKPKWVGFWNEDANEELYRSKLEWNSEQEQFERLHFPQKWTFLVMKKTDYDRIFS
jgi:hypothetical protein